MSQSGDAPLPPQKPKLTLEQKAETMYSGRRAAENRNRPPLSQEDSARLALMLWRRKQQREQEEQRGT